VKNARISKANHTPSSPAQDGASEWTSDTMPTSPTKTDVASPQSPSASDKGKEKEGAPVKKFRGIPENVKLFEVFWEQIVALIKVGYN
jgi:vacuolar protein sorting-associated protein 35